jgi:hypothetical protein
VGVTRGMFCCGVVVFVLSFGLVGFGSLVVVYVGLVLGVRRFCVCELVSYAWLQTLVCSV